ncbi:nuclease-related domain-containing protein [Streptomyces sp. NPDC006700]|uniref:nuclease-related domain-containing protein n=1 Tax=unclassified Streptomyces TaxID=2593676 RepID=UPI0033CC957A
MDGSTVSGDRLSASPARSSWTVSGWFARSVLEGPICAVKRQRPTSPAESAWWSTGTSPASRCPTPENFTFTANTGHVREADLLVVAPSGMYMIELKDWHGSVTPENGIWVQTTPGGRRRTHPVAARSAISPAARSSTRRVGRGAAESCFAVSVTRTP